MRSIVCDAELVCSVETHEVSRFGCGHGRADRNAVAHLADHHDVRVLSQHGAERGMETRGVTADLALRDDAFVLRKKIFHRILDRDDVVGARVIDLIHDRGERGRFSMPGRPHHKHESLRELGEVMKQRRKVQLFDRFDARRDKTQRGGEISALEIDVHAEPRLLFEAVREVDLALGEQFRLLLRREHLRNDPFRRFRRHDRLFFERDRAPRRCAGSACGPPQGEDPTHSASPSSSKDHSAVA